MRAKEKVYKKLQELIKNESVDGITTSQLEENLDIKRSVISHYLNILFEEGKVNKTNTRPVKYYIDKDGNDEEHMPKDNVFQDAIGYEGSLKTQIEQCKSAVVYPPKGLPIIIRGRSGVGKSFLAWLIYKHAIDKGVIKEEGKFVELNCADYANNPELLSAVLFGYVEGAFTGANKGKKGLMDEAHGGYLFLDEIHRLSKENQEKLFLYLDKGKFRRLGENDSWHSVDVRFIFATTEDVKSTLLETFYRRIPVRINLPDFQDRPLIERIELIYSFYKNEGQALGRDIVITNQVIDILTSSVEEGNIGMLKNYIKLSCANGYKNNINSERISITVEELPDELKGKNIKLLKKGGNREFIIKKEDNNVEFNKNIIGFNDEIENLRSYLNTSKDQFDNYSRIFIKKIKRKMCEMYGVDVGILDGGIYSNNNIKYIYNLLNEQIQVIKKRYGIVLSKSSKNSILSLITFFLLNLDEGLRNISISGYLSIIKRENHKALYITKILLNSFNDYEIENCTILIYLLSLIISEEVVCDTKIQAIIVAHGDSTASSIASVANTLAEGYIYEAFDMPITGSSKEIVNRVNSYIANIDTTGGLILLVDMGSLEQMYEPIKNHLGGELLIINNLTTNMAIDIGLRIVRGDSLQEIIDKSKENNKVEVRYYEGIAPGDNIVISCISGLGISQKLKEIFDKCLSNYNIEIVTLEYSKLKELIQTDSISKLRSTKLIITTNDIDIEQIYSINIEKIMSNEGGIILRKALNNVIGEDELKKLSDEIIKFFSIEGISNNLTFLNPNIVVYEVETIIKQIEMYYNVILKNNLRINLYMHIALMIERLMIGRVSEFEEEINLTRTQEDYVEFAKGVFSEIEAKYRIEIPLFELMLIYEIVECELEKENIVISDDHEWEF
ncbi:MAG: sigma 54-interacting transcriptional regulator [Clostridium paraputrificum]|uniref:sigma 54-interacting transcriptional regulator n=1 Tax=Clostridium TaxID=1485 RepID=UPI0018A01ECB|nr:MULTISPECIES: sigma 54-interacting transcriptional regulator [Clostridium]MDB2084937.1 sigma 54-interacting transcriptional regulator [Clostridium paraputrificum]MDU5741700.1 sigma 54-interacting transcriptional regulator [Clostridium sp.]MDU5785991.1 sigma 54-interacting transcriptional regulator [Clostridium sp.]